jgi:predicted TIM-barrel fold metal-dependent hydrolase
MEEAGVDVSVALGFAWREHELCVRQNDYLLETAAKSNGRIVAFCTVNMSDAGSEEEVRRCLAGGARGLGELRPDSQGWDLNGGPGERLAALAERYRLVLLFHVTEPVGHDYPGKRGGDLGAFLEFVSRYPEVRVVGAHFAGGLPLYAAMPEVRQAFSGALHVDTAAQPLLYQRGAYERLVRLVGAERMLLGSDYPLLSQDRQIDEVRSAVADSEAQRLILGANAERLLMMNSDDEPG